MGLCRLLCQQGDGVRACPICGNSRQVWVNENTGLVTCHRAWCGKVINEGEEMNLKLELLQRLDEDEILRGLKSEWHIVINRLKQGMDCDELEEVATHLSNLYAEALQDIYGGVQCGIELLDGDFKPPSMPTAPTRYTEPEQDF